MQNDHGRRDGSTRQRAVATLCELIKALDRRMSHVERLGEARIAREAAALRAEATKRIEQLNAESEHHTDEAVFSDAVMTDVADQSAKADDPVSNRLDLGARSEKMRK